MKLRLVVAAVAAAIFVPALVTTVSTALPPCPEEDSNSNCVWLAPFAGNGVGHSFVVWNETVYYLD